MIEHYAGSFPTWLAPIQVELIPVADRHLNYAYELETKLKVDNIRTEVDARPERINQKIRQAQLNKVPYMIIIGDKEVHDKTVSIRLRSGEQLPPQSLESFKKTINDIICNKS